MTLASASAPREADHESGKSQAKATSAAKTARTRALKRSRALAEAR